MFKGWNGERRESKKGSMQEVDWRREKEGGDEEYDENVLKRREKKKGWQEIKGRKEKADKGR